MPFCHFSLSFLPLMLSSLGVFGLAGSFRYFFLLLGFRRALCCLGLFCVQHPIPPVEMGVVMPLLKGRGHSSVGRNRETREENGAPIFCVVLFPVRFFSMLPRRGRVF
jgi:hypothetical protein